MAETLLPIRGDHITLGNLLKVVGIVSTGGEVKDFLADQSVPINGERDKRRGRKIFPGDLVSLPGETLIRVTSGE
jgi:ribosome-associated protein YbcJ (S4-like RNA binding protein)